MVNLERCQCRCGQSTWSRLTKSFFGSLRQHTASLRSRRTRSQRPSRSELKSPRESLYKSHPSVRTGYPTTPPTEEPTELENSIFIPELNGSSMSGSHFNGVSGQTPAGVHSSSFSYPQGLEYPPSWHELADSSSTGQQHMTTTQGQTQPPSFYEPVALGPAPNPRTMARYNHTPTTPSTIPSLATSMMSQRGSGFFSTPHSSVSSAASSLIPDGTTTSAAGVPVFTTETTSSPLEYEPDRTPWNVSQPMPQHEASYRAELPENTPTSISELETPEWARPKRTIGSRKWTPLRRS